MITIPYEKVLNAKDEYIIVDTRSPREYAFSTIPNAISIPLFTNEQFEKIGITYKEGGKEEAILQGVDYISERLPSMIKEFMEIYHTGSRIAIFCARGGMRSASITGLLHSLGLPVVRIDKGYKGYRAYINAHFPDLVENFTFIPLYGKTGTGKTYVLYELENLGEPVLDLENCANHRGSLLGSIGLTPCNSQKMFESLVFHKLHYIKNVLNKDYLYTEGESKRIGRIVMPDFLYDKVLNGEKILVESPIGYRVTNIKEEYLGKNLVNNTVSSEYKEELKEALTFLTPYAGENSVKEYLQSIDNDDFDNLIETLMVKYYDTKYSTKNKQFVWEITNENNLDTAKNIIKYRNRNNELC